MFFHLYESLWQTFQRVRKYQLRQTVVTPSETQPFGQGMGDPYFVAVTGARAEGLSAATLDEVNHIGLAYKPTANRGVAQFASLVSMDEVRNLSHGIKNEEAICP